MHVTEVQLSNIKGFRDGEFGVSLNFSSASTGIPRWVVVAGRNGAGKSTFLQALALAIAGPSAARTLRETFADWIRDGAQVGAVRAQLSYANDDGFGRGRRPGFSPWVGLTWTRQDDGPEPVLKREPFGGVWDPARGPWTENPQGWFLAGYGPFRRLSLAPTEAQRLMMTPGRPASLASLFREEASLSESVPWLQQVYLRRLEGAADAAELETAVLRLIGDGLLPEGMRVVRVNSDGLWVRPPNGPELPLRSLSDGYRTVAALVIDLLKQLHHAYGHLQMVAGDDGIAFPHEGVVLIDEIDVHLHVSWQQRIGFWLKDHFPGLQFIVSTHSPFICQAADERGLVRLPGPGEDESARIIEGELFHRVVNGSADDAVLTDLFGLDTPYSARAVSLRSEVAQLEGRATMGRLTSDEQDRLRDLQEQLPSTVSTDVAAAVRQLGIDLGHAQD